MTISLFRIRRAKRISNFILVYYIIHLNVGKYDHTNTRLTCMFFFFSFIDIDSQDEFNDKFDNR